MVAPRLVLIAALALALAAGAGGCPQWTSEGTVVGVNLVKGTVTIRMRGKKVRTFRGSQNQAATVSRGQLVRFSYSGDTLISLEVLGWAPPPEED